jgi:ankyrin repeat protein
VTEDASTPLHKACAGSKAGHLAAVKFLLDGEADVHSLNKWRETPLLTAANHGQAGAVEALLKAGADPCKCTDTGWSPLSIAAYKGHDDVVRLLLEEGAPTEEDDPTLSALLQAATKGLPDTVELLLLHGADHTVTTKKGDTALSILVEQNLIDAAVDMVSEYNASIPRCSRDRKKVQRARLLINLRLKQLEREGKAVTVSTDDDETDDESEESKLALHDENSGMLSEATSSGKKKKKGKMSAEDKAKAAEDALLLELEQEDEQVKQEEAKANSKQAKKKKKKERERLQKMKEDQERSDREARETKEQERLKMERETKERKEREKKQHAQREREMKERLAQEKVLVAKRKEREEEERRLREQNGREEMAAGEASIPVSPSGSNESAKRETERSTPQTAAKTSTAASSATGAPLAGNRRWETKSSSKSSSTETYVQTMPDEIPSVKYTATPAEPQPSELAPSTFVSPLSNVREANGDMMSSFLSFDEDHGTQPSAEPASELPAAFVASAVEHPAIALFRRDKVSELIQRCTHALDVVDELTIKRVIYRWVVRASHEQTRCADPIIPSWVDFDQLVAFFQRQFISESRRGSGNTSGIASMEKLKEAGSSVAVLCRNLAKEVSEVRQRIQEQLPSDWTDVALGMAASDGTHNGSGSVVTISWANRWQVYLPTRTFAALRDRHTGPPNRFLTASFVAKIYHETNRLIVVDTPMDFRLSPDTLACLSTEASVSVELWTDPFSTWNDNVFWGKFDEIDSFFGGQKPFGKDERGGEEVLAQHGGSISVLLPFDNMIASRYVQRMLDILDGANSSNVAVSFAVFLRTDSFHDLPSGLSVNNLRLLDSRLADQQQTYVRHTEVLPAGQHLYHCGEDAGTVKVDSSDSLFVLLQSRAGRSRFAISDASISRIIGSMSVNRNDKAIVTPIVFNDDYSAMQSPLSSRSGYFDSLAPPTQEPQRTAEFEFGAIGGAASYTKAFSPSEPASRLGPRRGRLFDLVDDLEEDHVDDVDLVSGMLNNLDVGLFQNSNNSTDVDIEAISLMGIGGPPSASLPPRDSHSRRFG